MLEIAACKLPGFAKRAAWSLLRCNALLVQRIISVTVKDDKAQLSCLAQLRFNSNHWMTSRSQWPIVTLLVMSAFKSCK